MSDVYYIFFIAIVIVVDNYLTRRKLDLLLEGKEVIQNMADEIKHTLDETLASVQDEKTVVEGLAKLTSDLKARLDEILAGNLTPEQQAKVDAIFAETEARKQELAAAITANTEPPPPEGTPVA
jgi:hypothetical protein